MEKRAYDDSDRRRSVPLATPHACKDALAEIERGLAADARGVVEGATRALVAEVVAQTGAPPVVVHVLAVRPSDEDGELHGFYEMDDDSGACELKVWMRTAAKKKPVALRSYVRTVLHELCHHLDFARDRLDHSFHTHGFFARESDLARQILGPSPRGRRQWIPYCEPSSVREVYSHAPSATGAGESSGAERNASVGRSRFPPAASASIPTAATTPGWLPTTTRSRVSICSR